jgi:hypothetical protein
MTKMLLNTKHEAFAQHVAQHGNVADAARSVGYLNHPAQRGSDLLRRPDVQARVEELLRDRPSLPARLAQHLDAATVQRLSAAVALLASLV